MCGLRGASESPATDLAALKVADEFLNVPNRNWSGMECILKSTATLVVTFVSSTCSSG